MGKILTLGLDGATWKLLKPWIDDGELPILKKLAENGCRGVLKSTIPATTSPAMLALETGKNPAKLGVFGFVGGDNTLVKRNLKDKCVWEILSESGKKVCIFNMPLTYPPDKVNGVMISGMLTPSGESDFTYPSSLKKKHDFPIDLDWGELFNKYSKKEFAAEIEKMTNKRFQVLRQILRENGYDLVMFYVGGTDVLQHFIWNEKTILLDYYKSVDKNIGQLMNEFKFRDVIVFSDHGFESSPSHFFYVNEWLRKEGCLKVKMKGLKRFYKFAYVAARKILPPNVTTNIKKAVLTQPVQTGKKSSLQFVLGIDLNKTKAHQNIDWGITLLKENLGRNEYEKLRNELIDKLRKLKFGNNFVMKEVRKREELFAGDFLDRVPDIIFVPVEGFHTPPYLSDEMFTKSTRQKRQGCHTYDRNAVFIACGSDIKKSSKEIKGLEIVDMAPLLLHMFDISIPRDMDGKVPREIFKKESEPAKRKVKYQDEKKRKTEIEKLFIKSKIKRLGL